MWQQQLSWWYKGIWMKSQDHSSPFIWQEYILSLLPIKKKSIENIFFSSSAVRVSLVVAGGNLLFKHDEAELLNTQSEALERLKETRIRWLIHTRRTSFVTDFSGQYSQISKPQKNMEYGPFGLRRIWMWGCRCNQEAWALAGLQVEEDPGFIPGSMSSRRVGAGSFTTVPATAQYNPRAKDTWKSPSWALPKLTPSLLPQEGAR